MRSLLLSFALLICIVNINAQDCSLKYDTLLSIVNPFLRVGDDYNKVITFKNESQDDILLTDFRFENAYLYNAVKADFFDSEIVLKGLSNNTQTITLHFIHNMPIKGFVTLRMKCKCYDKLLCIKVESTLTPKISNPDYSFTNSLEYDSLYSALQSKVVNHNSLTYKPAREVMFGKADNIRDSVECIYTGRKLKTAGIPPNGEFNTEHTWPQSYGSSNEPNKSDINHLYPTYPNANSIRANFPFGKVITVWKDAGGGSKLGFTAKGDTVFEPRDISKGNIARSIFYYMVRYGNLMNYYTTPYSMDADLRLWNRADPPDDKELRRCDTIAAYQGKRNPFVDYPELVERLEFIPANHKNDVGITTNRIVFAPENKDTIQTILYNKWKDTATVTSVLLTDTANFTTDINVGDVLTPHTLRIVNIAYTKASPLTLKGRTYLVSGYSNGKYDTLEFDNCAITPVEQEQQPVQTQVRPQPFDNTATVECSLHAEDITRVALFSIDGREAHDITNRIQPTNNGTMLHITKSDTQQYGRILVVRFYTPTSVVSQMVIAE